MAKPSIFSRDYEKRMRRRRRRIITTIIIIILVAVGIFLKFKLDDIDFGNLKNKIQAWVDSGKPEKEEKEEKEEVVDKEKPEKEDKEEKEEKKYIELKVGNNNILKAEYIENNNLKEFVEIDQSSNIENLEYDISPSKNKIIIKDKDQNLFLYDINGNVKDVTKKQYVSGAGDVFLKDNILSGDPNYLWHSQVKFIDDTSIVYVSSLPYFGTSAVNKYLWICNTDNATENCLWNYNGTEITFGNVLPEKGISVNINGTQYYLSANGTLVQ